MDRDEAGYRTRPTDPRGWPVQSGSELWDCHEAVDTLEKRPLAGTSLPDLLSRLKTSDFASRAAMVREGREVRFLDAEWIVQRLIHALANEQNAELIIENELNDLFRSLRKGVMFEFTEVVMAIMYALKRSRSSLYGKLSAAILDSKMVEVSRLRYLATKLDDRF